MHNAVAPHRCTQVYKLLKKPHPGYRLYGYAYSALSLAMAFAFGLTVYTGIIVLL